MHKMQGNNLLLSSVVVLVGSCVIIWRLSTVSSIRDAPSNCKADHWKWSSLGKVLNAVSDDFDIVNGSEKSQMDLPSEQGEPPEDVTRTSTDSLATHSHNVNANTSRDGVAIDTHHLNTSSSAMMALNDNEQQDVFVDKDDVADRSSALSQQAKTTRLLTTTASSIPSHLETSRKTMEDADMNHQPVRPYPCETVSNAVPIKFSITGTQFFQKANAALGLTIRPMEHGELAQYSDPADKTIKKETPVVKRVKDAGAIIQFYNDKNKNDPERQVQVGDHWVRWAFLPKKAEDSSGRKEFTAQGIVDEVRRLAKDKKKCQNRTKTDKKDCAKFVDWKQDGNMTWWDENIEFEFRKGNLDNTCKFYLGVDQDDSPWTWDML